MNDDAALLRRYVEEKSEAAFAELVRRHLDLVYSAAVRRLGGDAHGAADVAQQVFAKLAREATGLSRHTMLTAWLYVATRNAVVDAIRAERRRRGRELEAHAMHMLNKSTGSDDDWQRLRLVLDEVMDELSEADRRAVLLRFFERRPFGEIGAALRVGEDTARMRVQRALEKLRERLARRGVTSTAAALGAVLANQAVVAAPVGLAGSVASGATALVAGATGATGATTLGAGLVHFMANGKLMMGAAAALAILAGGVVLQQQAKRQAAEESLASATHGYEARRVIAREIERRIQRAEREAGELRQRVNDAKAAAAKVTAAPVKDSPPAVRSPGAEGKLFLARHPEVKEALTAWVTSAMRTEWAPFIHDHALTEAQVEELLMLTRNMSLDPGPGPDGTEMDLYVGNDLKITERNRRITALLGEGGVAEFEEFQRTTSVRRLTNKVTEALAFSETPLSPGQWRELTPILIRNPASGVEAATMQFDWQGVMAGTQGVLSAPQLAVLDGMRTEDRLRHALDRLSRSKAQ